MLNQHEIFETLNMIDEQHLDIRTITMGISLRDCGHPDAKVSATKMYDKITKYAKDLVKTGEEIERLKHTLTLITSDKKSHVTGSNACFMSFNDIIQIKGKPTFDNPMYLKVIETPAKEKGHTYLRLKPVKKEDVING